VFSILKPRKDLALPSSYRPISLLDTIDKLFEKIQDSLRSERMRVTARCAVCTVLQLSLLVERVSRNFDEKRLTGAIFLDVAKAFDAEWVDGLLYKLTSLIFPRTLSKPYPHI